MHGFLKVTVSERALRRGLLRTMCFITTMVITSLPSYTLALTGELTNDPAKVVKKYLSLDKRGARLEAIAFEALKPYITWTDEPAWGHVVVIGKFQVQGDIGLWEVISSVEAFIPVTFHVLGTMQWETATFLAEPRTETMRFRVRAIQNRWRIVEPMFPPHVGRKRLIDFVRLAWLQETDANKKERLHRLRKALEEANQ